MRLVTCVLFLTILGPAMTGLGQDRSDAAAALPRAHFSLRNDGSAISIVDGKKPIASYVYRHPKVHRPFFAHVKTPGGFQVTRNFPPVDGQDRMDHPSMHPGIWLAFGDINGGDYWRNKSRVRHQRFEHGPAIAANRVVFTEAKAYTTNDEQIICHEVFRCVVSRVKEGYLYEFDSTFRPPAGEIAVFGDQEEMGLGIRVAATIAEIGGGTMTDSEGRRGAKQIWSQAADWVDYRGIVGGTPVGMTILCHPKNFRRSWLHARDYGLIAANAFGRRAMQKGEISQVKVASNKPLRLRYGVLVYEGASTATNAYQAYVRQTRP